jgi:Flp pilus assembly protein TadG
MLRRNEAGAAAVEFALVLIPLLLLVFGIIEFGLILYDKQIITYASGVGARLGTVYPAPNAAAIQANVRNYLTGAGLNAGTATINVTGDQGPSGTNLTVQVVYTYTFIVLPNIMSLVGTSLGPNLTLTAQTVVQNP